MGDLVKCNKSESFEDPKYEMWRLEAQSRMWQIEELNRINSAKQREIDRLRRKIDNINIDINREHQGSRYVIGTALFDIFRHPFHFRKPLLKIVQQIKNKRQMYMHPIVFEEALKTPKTEPDVEEILEENADKLRLEQRRSAKEKGKAFWLIKCPAPEKNKIQWGDYHFCVSLAEALTRKGLYVEVQLYDNWLESVDPDVILVIRGIRKYTFSPLDNAFHIMWNISHPEDVNEDEYNQFDLVCVASEYYSRLLELRLHVPVIPLLQCTDTTRFYLTQEEKSITRRGLLFIGNGRKSGRLCVNWAAANGEPLKLYGNNWSSNLLNAEQFLVGDSIENTSIRNEYIRAKATLNNHWESMRAYQFINNRVFDALSCGLPVVTDEFEELKRLFPDEILYYHDKESFLERLTELNDHYELILAKVDATRELIKNKFSFDARAETLIREWKARMKKSGAGNREPGDEEITVSVNENYS